PIFIHLCYNTITRQISLLFIKIIPRDTNSIIVSGFPLIYKFLYVNFRTRIVLNDLCESILEQPRNDAKVTISECTHWRRQ
ncbi:hypothetical protein PENTCL1PPCAC_20688, partial [Pristionchus entomophagus]